MNGQAETAFLASNAFIIYANTEFKVKSWLLQ